MGFGRLAMWALIASVPVGGIAMAADALVDTDEERIGDLAEAMTDARADRRVDAVLAWVDTTRVPVVVRADGAAEEFGEDDDDPGDAIRGALEPLAAERLDVVQRSIDVHGDSARIALRVRADGELADAQLDLERDGQSWLVREVRRLD